MRDYNTASRLGRGHCEDLRASQLQLNDGASELAAQLSDVHSDICTCSMIERLEDAPLRLEVGTGSS